MEQIKISVRNLVEFVLRSGDIDNRRGKSGQKEAMQEGSRIHRKIQRRMGASYQPEVPLKIELQKEKYQLLIEGRADGIIIEETGVTIDEIKGVYMDVQALEAPIEVHLAQAKCYAYIFAKQQELEEIRVQMTYCNLDTEEIRRFQQSYSFEEIREWFEMVVGLYEKWANFQYEARIERNTSIEKLEFPYPYREGQKELAAGVYRTINREKNLFIQAPTGTGKTITTVFPAVKAVGEELADKIFYLTAKTITRTVAKETFDLLRKQGYLGRVITITAKEKLCMCEEMDCNPVHCPYAEGHYDRVNDAVFDLIQTERDITREVLIQQAEKFRVCPFELCLDTTLWVDDIICDYNYVFDPNVYLKRFFAEGVKGEYLFLIDEAHNLVERGREMYSAVLYKEDFLKVKKIMKEHSRKCVKALEKCNSHLLELKRQCDNYEILDNLGAFVFLLMQLGAALEEFFLKDISFPEKKEVQEFYLELRHFLNMYERVDENYVVYTEHEADGRFKVKLYCVDTAVNLQECLDKGRSTIFFSATLLPIQYYKKLLSTKEDNYAVYAKTVFSKEQRLLVIGTDVSSKYTRRNEREFTKIARYIYETAQGRKGNYMAFFPSYKMMGQVLEKFYALNLGEMDCVVQESGMREQEREEFLEAFRMERENTLVGFCVMGGIFSEGIDLKNEALIGAVIVGTGLPQISNEREILKNYYDKRYGEGFDYAFRYPGMNKVLQSAGRVIRTVEDKGVIVLLDERFLQREYLGMFPREWADYEKVTVENVQERVKKFWSN
ncbi:ATP-dependent DNA helicase [Roseburia sp. MSJ-14]|uniref:ATP-dependent DNA helicase n=1 Tax=Roseburia sp. MSJ-14 TaxID=2841514 RepID=UPI001C11ABCE|nr:ATP-dependent DNA helicase [Roseburia sp. MSJ-14]MBU5472368.1 ATP-dependent DNA helicase [Roseburia sp. MSJ-14]